MFLLNNKPLPIDTPFSVGEGDDAIFYPSNWLRYATSEEKAKIGITEVPDPVKVDDRFYWNGDINHPKELEDVEAKDEDGKPIVDEKGNPVITKGLKSNFISQVKQTAGSILSQSDWYITRNAEIGVAIPNNVTTYRASIRLRANELEEAIKAVETVEELASLDMSFPQE